MFVSNSPRPWYMVTVVRRWVDGTRGVATYT